MAYDATLAERVQQILRDRDDVVAKKMFGGLALMVGGHMCCGVIGDRLMVRVGPDAYVDAINQPHAGPMDLTGRPMNGMVYVNRDGCADDADLSAWVGRGLSFVSTLAPKNR